MSAAPDTGLHGLGHDHSHGHGRGRGHLHAHTHGTVDPALLATAQGISAVKWSLVILGATAAAQLVIVALSGSVALLADSVHNVGDALTAVPLWIAFSLARRPPSRRYTYGLGRAEDLAGLFVVLAVLFSAVFAAYESVLRIVEPQPITHLGAVAVAAAVGFFGNEAVAQLRIRTGKRIGSAALVADGAHARVDGFTSLAVLGGVVAVWAGVPLADPVVGLVISAAIFWIVWQSARSVFRRALEGVDPEVVDEIRHAAGHVPGVTEVTETRARWTGHRLRAEVSVTVPDGLTVAEGHRTAVEVRHQLLHHLRYLSDAAVHMDPASASGGDHHRIAGHAHGGLPPHAH